MTSRGPWDDPRHQGPDHVADPPPGWPPHGGSPGGSAPYRGDPYGGDPYRGDPYSGDPYSGDPYSGDPYRTDTHEGAPYRADPLGGAPHEQYGAQGPRPAPAQASYELPPTPRQGRGDGSRRRPDVGGPSGPGRGQGQGRGRNRGQGRAEGRGDRPDRDQGRGRRSGRRQEQLRRQAQAREIRWHNNRLAVPYPTDGPKVTFGVIWFAVIVAAMVVSPLAVAVVAAGVAALAGLQTGMAWFPQFGATRWWTAAAAFVTALSGALGGLGLVAGAGLGAMLLLLYLVVNPVHHRSTLELVDVLLRSALPVGIAAGSLAALRSVDLGAVLLLVALVSAYETGDFLVGSGSSNAVEGPVSGLVALSVVGFVAWILAPAPFTNTSVLLFSALAGVCCPLGQILAAAILPRGSAWAPALRRLDSYLLIAPLWLVLLGSVAGARSL